MCNGHRVKWPLGYKVRQLSEKGEGVAPHSEAQGGRGPCMERADRLAGKDRTAAAVPSPLPPPPTQPDPNGAFRAAQYGHRWSEFDPHVGKTVWRRETHQKKRRRSATVQEIEAHIPEVSSPPQPAAAQPQALERKRPHRNRKMDISFLLNEGT
jgi:hypothetical protein